MIIPYTRDNWPLACQIMEASHQALSRTFRGVSDTKASSSKHPLLLDGEALELQCAANAQRLYALLFEMSHQAAPTTPAQVAERMRTIEDAVNQGLLPDGRFRNWGVSYKEDCAFATKVPWESLPQEMDRFAEEIFQRWSELEADPLALAAWAEWKIQGPLHPYYDGCGRISRGISCWLLTCGQAPLPVYTDRKEWFDHAMAGVEPFTAYVRTCCQAGGHILAP